jgi:hypothetical protein
VYSCGRPCFLEELCVGLFLGFEIRNYSHCVM